MESTVEDNGSKNGSQGDLEDPQFVGIDVPSPNQEARTNPEVAKPTDKMAAMEAHIKVMEEKLENFLQSDSEFKENL